MHVSKFAQITGGVETHIQSLMRAQRQAGLNVELFSSESLEGGSPFQSDPHHGSVSARLRSVKTTLWSTDSRRQLEEATYRFRPDILHYHSVYHQLSPSVLRVRQDIPAVMTLHDYKLVAPCYSLFRDGNACTECVGRTVATGCLRHRCVKGAFSSSGICVSEDILHRSYYAKRIERFIVPSHFSRSLYIASGRFDPSVLTVIPHGVEYSGIQALPDSSRRVLFVGRLSAEKSASDLLEAWSLTTTAKRRLVLRVIGDGPQRDALEAKSPQGVEWLGWRSQPEIQVEFAAARFVVVPSRFLETFGLVAAEAMCAGLPVIASSAGALLELVSSSGGGMNYESGNILALARSLDALASDNDAARAMGRRGRRYTTVELTISTMEEKTRQVYEEILGA